VTDENYRRQYARGLRVKYSRFIPHQLSEPFLRKIGGDIAGMSDRERTNAVAPSSALVFADYLDDHGDGDPRAAIIRHYTEHHPDGYAGSDAAVEEAWTSHRVDPVSTLFASRYRTPATGRESYRIESVWDTGVPHPAGGNRSLPVHITFDSPEGLLEHLSTYPEEARRRLGRIVERRPEDNIPL
jgi:hypothetical protein